MFRRILHANNGSKPAFQALGLALAIARQNNSDLHMVSVEEIDYIPAFIEEIRQQASPALPPRPSAGLRDGRGKSRQASYPCPRRPSGADYHSTYG
jgi:hypothetical protein